MSGEEKKTNPKPLCKIEGDKVKDEKTFYEQVQQRTGKKFDPNMDAFTEFLNSSFVDGGIDFVWEKADESEKNLGKNTMHNILKTLRDHGPGGERPKDNVHLHLT